MLDEMEVKGVFFESCDQCYSICISQYCRLIWDCSFILVQMFSLSIVLLPSSNSISDVQHC